MTTAQFDSDTSFALVREQVDYRYPSNLLEVDDVKLTIKFNGDEPDFQVKQLVANHGGWFQ